MYGDKGFAYGRNHEIEEINSSRVIITNSTIYQQLENRI